jgi:hypothetical protein
MTSSLERKAPRRAWLRRWAPALVIFLLAGLVPVEDTLAERVITSRRVYKYVNVREAPGTRSEIVGALWPEEDAILLESTPGWYRIRLINKAEGYVSSHWTVVIPGPEFCRKEHDPDCRK